MTRLSGINRRKFEKWLKKKGWTLSRVSGSHFIYSNPSHRDRIVIPYDKEISIGVVKDALNKVSIPVSDFMDEYIKKNKH